MEEKDSKGVPQFATAEYSKQPGTAICKSCGKSISGASYRANEVTVCGELRSAFHESSAGRLALSLCARDSPSPQVGSSALSHSPSVMSSVKLSCLAPAASAAGAIKWLRFYRPT